MEGDEFAISVIADLLEERTGQKLTSNRRWRIGTALAGLFRQHDITSIEQLVVQLTQPGQAALAQEVIEALLNNETYFFRDRAMFDHLSLRILPQLYDLRSDSRKISIWSVGCSTGQEVLSLAMLFAESRARWKDWSIDILGTDISSSVIDKARMGRYSHFEVQRGLGVAQMLTFFEETAQGWQTSDELLRMVRYERHNLLDSPPNPGRFDIILCRNVLLYFDGETRQKAFDQLAKGMGPDSFLMLGAGETVVGHTASFAPCAENNGFYRANGKGGGERGLQPGALAV
ncbi:MAG TPA: protein-glutamate O-methyltransferase CheR [Sphingomonadaceae bacterium]|nr:protein-glutamate O-methyltransferase CheR [Sphingomonadaceae bacterium]